MQLKKNTENQLSTVEYHLNIFLIKTIPTVEL